MDFVHVSIEAIDRNWPQIAATMWPAVRADPRYSMEALRKRLTTPREGSTFGLDQLLRLSGEADCFMVIEVSDSLVFWIKGLAGAIHGGPKAKVRTIRGTVAFMEQMARGAGCREVRLCGRDWSKLLPDYEPFDGLRNGLRKVLPDVGQ